MPLMRGCSKMRTLGGALSLSHQDRTMRLSCPILKSHPCSHLFTLVEKVRASPFTREHVQKVAATLNTCVPRMEMHVMIK
jgi:hypothetical protein